MSRANKPFVGFGDPLLDGHPGARRNAELSSLVSRGGVVDVAELRTLPALPETAEELRALAQSLHASKGSIFLREMATERRVRSASLADYRVIAFATHALVSGEIEGFTGPASDETPTRPRTRIGHDEI